MTSIRIPPLPLSSTSSTSPTPSSSSSTSVSKSIPKLVLSELKQEISLELKEEYGKLSWFALGLALGSILDFFTVIVMFCIGILIDNRPLPSIFGNITPRELVSNLIKSVVRMTHKLAKGRE